MPQRQNTKRVKSDEVQGEDSWVEVRRLTYGEIVTMRASSGGDRLEQSAAVVTAIVINWNWVDDAGTPLPLPSVDPSVINQLTDAEIAFIGTALGAEARSEEPLTN